MAKWIVCLVIGLGMLSLSSGAGINDNTIRCGSDIMGPGDVCEETRAGSVVDTQTYEEMKESKEAGQRIFNSWGRWALLGGGLILTVLGIWGIVKVKRQRKEPRPGEPNQSHPRQPSHVSPAQQQTNYAPPVNYAPQPLPTHAPPVNHAPPRQSTYAPPPPATYGPPPQQQGYYPPPQPQQPFGPGAQQPQQPFGPGSQQ